MYSLEPLKAAACSWWPILFRKCRMRAGTSAFVRARFALAHLGHEQDGSEACTGLGRQAPGAMQGCPASMCMRGGVSGGGGRAHTQPGGGPQHGSSCTYPTRYWTSTCSTPSFNSGFLPGPPPCHLPTLILVTVLRDTRCCFSTGEAGSVGEEGRGQSLISKNRRKMKKTHSPRESGARRARPEHEPQASQRTAQCSLAAL